eukprot:ctg_2018.g550
MPALAMCRLMRRRQRQGRTSVLGRATRRCGHRCALQRVFRGVEHERAAPVVLFALRAHVWVVVFGAMAEAAAAGGGAVVPTVQAAGVVGGRATVICVVHHRSGRGAECDALFVAATAAAGAGVGARTCEKEALRRALLQERARRIELERELCRVREALTRPPVAPAREMVGAVAMPAEKEPGVAPAVTAADANASPSSRTRLEIRLVGSVTAGMRNCRVASFHAPTETLLVSTGDVGQAVAAAVDSYGLRRLCLQRPSDASPPTAALHRAPIRDLAAQDALLACVSLDGQMTLVHATSLAVVARVATGRPLWSVAFASPPQPHAIALGTADATVLLYDTRKLDAAVQRYKPAGGCGGAHSLQTLSMGQAGVCVRITEATLQSLSSTQLSGEGDGARQETLWSQSVATPSQCYSMRCRNGYRLASYRGGSGAYHLLAQVNTDGCDAEAVTRANGFVPGPCLDRTDFWMPAADASRAVIFSGDAQHPNAVAYWTAGATSPQHFRGLASTAEAVRSVVCSDAHPLLAVVQSGAVQVLRWRCEDV